MEYTLKIEHLKTQFHTAKGIVPAVDDVSIEIPKGKIVGLVGESGCGKSMTAMSVMQLVRKPGKIVDGKIMLLGKNLLDTTDKEMQQIRGNDIAMIFQEPMTSLNPVYTVGRQVREAILLHQKVSKEEAKSRVIEVFRKCGIPEPEKRYHAYPHQLSGGLRQRVMIAMAMVCEPELLIADEPTTALDVTIEAQILKLMKQLRDEHGTSILMITHNMGVVAQMCDYVYVMYAGKVMEQAETFELFRNTQHPYTAGLLRSIPKMDSQVDRLYSICGVVPNLLKLPAGCSFCTRCDRADAHCRQVRPELYEAAPGHFVRCFQNQEGGVSHDGT
jgi:oligopeptide/dipeptide ABC transporter ATP-binding protein